MMSKKPWFDEFRGPLERIAPEQDFTPWSARDWEQFQREYPERPEACEEQLKRASDIETAFSCEMSLWDFVSDDAPTHVLDKLPELKAVLKKISIVQREILKLFYLEKKADREIAKLLGKSPNSVKLQRWKVLKKLVRALETDKKSGSFYGHINI